MLDDFDTNPLAGLSRVHEAESGPVVENETMRAVYRLAARIAPSHAPVLILGETGTGKDVLATFIAKESKRPTARMRTLNCATLPAHLMEAALFGHERGAFTGAVRSAPGVFEQANGGTVFLDEVGELSPAAQAALLRVLENGRLTRIGSERELVVDTRVIAATNCELEQMVEQGRFRRDLLYRLNTVTLELRPLRERTEEIVPLARHFLCRAETRWQTGSRTLSEHVERLLLRYAWPGNVRQLRNVIERAALLCDGCHIEAQHLPSAIAAEPDAPPPRGRTPELSPHDPAQDVCASGSSGLRAALRRYERLLIERALESTGGNQSRAAELLEIPRRTLVRKLRGA